MGKLYPEVFPLKKTLLFTLSHLFVAILATVATLAVTFGLDSFAPGKLNQLESLIQERFIGEADRTAMEDAAANAMVESLGDRWSYYIPADQFDTHKETMENAYVGIGITILARNDGSGFSIEAVTEGGGAEEAGLLPGDLIIGVAGEDVRGMDINQTRALVRGKEGSTVSVTVIREEQELTVQVERRRFETPVATGELLDGGFGLVTIENFDERCASETIAAIEELLSQGAESLIFDVRGNPGGYASELTDLLDYLLPEGEIFHTVTYDGTENIGYSDAACLDIPMAVLVNADSYSAAEFFAAALQEYGAAVVVGTPTSGKGYFQNTYRLTDGSAVGLSIGKYYTPQGKNLQDVGITPDIVSEVDEETYLNIYYGRLTPGEDPQVQAAIQALS